MSDNLENISINNTEKKQTNLEELRKMVLDINSEQLKNIKNRAFIEIFQMGLKLERFYDENTNLLLDLEKDGEKITVIFKKIYNILFEVNNRVEPQELLKNLGIDYFNSLRDDVENLLLGLAGYITEISYVHEISREIIHRDQVYRAYGQVIEDVDVNKLYKKIYNFLTEDMRILSQKIVEIVYSIPLKITRGKYYDLIKTSIIQELKGNSREKINLYLERYKSIFNGSMEPQYGQKFDYYFRKTHELKLLDLESLTLKEAKETYDKSLKVLNEINSVTSLIIQIGLLANRYIVLKMLEGKTPEYKDTEIDDILRLWNRYIEQKKEELEGKISNLCEHKIKELELSLREINIKLQKLMKEYFTNEELLNEALNSELLRTQKALAYLNDISIIKRELLFEDSAEAASSSYIEESINSFIAFLDRNIKNMSNKERKVRMRRLLCLVDNLFTSPDDFFSYLRSSLETSKSKEELIINSNLIAEVMSRYSK